MLFMNNHLVGIYLQIIIPNELNHDLFSEM